MTKSASRRKKKRNLPRLFVELTSVILSGTLFALEDKNAFLTLIPQLIAAPGKKENLAIMESVLKKNLDQAITLNVRRGS